MNRTHLLALLLFLSAACTQQTQEREEEEKEEQEEVEEGSGERTSASIVITDLDTALATVPVDSVEDEDELPREVIIKDGDRTFHFTLVPDKEADGKVQYVVRRFEEVPEVEVERKQGMVNISMDSPKGRPLRLQLPAKFFD